MTYTFLLIHKGFPECWRHFQFSHSFVWVLPIMTYPIWIQRHFCPPHFQELPPGGYYLVSSQRDCPLILALTSLPPSSSQNSVVSHRSGCRLRVWQSKLNSPPACLPLHFTPSLILANFIHASLNLNPTAACPLYPAHSQRRSCFRLLLYSHNSANFCSK
jgi:hypothetical protein